jgi:hypothetical protein
MSALLVEPLEARLSRLHPGAVCVERRDNPPHRRFVVEVPNGKHWDVIGSGSTRRDAIQQAEHRSEVRR